MAIVPGSGKMRMAAGKCMIVHLVCSWKKARTSGDTHVELTAAGRKYRVDVKKMEQINIKTKIARKVQRICNGTTGAGTEASSVLLMVAESTSADAGSTAQNKRESKTGKAGKHVADAGADTMAAKRAKSYTTENSATNDQTNGKVKTLVVKGRAPVDPECLVANSMHVYVEGGDIYDVMLNQTDVGNNNNKYYVIQLLESDTKREYNVWNHWGRVGFKGQSSLLPCHSDLDRAKQLFCQKFADKTRNDWSARHKFIKCPGKYDMVEIDYNAQDSTDGERKKQQEAKIPESKLDERLQELIKLMCDVKAMENVVMEMKYDANKAPLGRLTKEQIKAGYSALQCIANCIDKAELGGQLTAACNDFYTRIPHYFGMSRPPVIRTKAEVQAKLSLLEALGDIEIAMRVLKDCKVTENPVDSHYRALNCELRLMDHTDPVFKVIEQYLTNTHAPTHTLYKMKLLDVFEVQRSVELQNFVDYGNRMLLWHGSRLTNMVGILSSGLRVAPPEAPVTGYMFGKGIYFADMSSKSANYCYATRTKNIGLVLLSEVSLGRCHELLDADSDAHKLPSGYHSVKCLGKMAPDSTHNHILSDGTVVPLGKPQDTGVSNPAGYTLNYNEFVVYNPRQVKMRYAVQVRFEFR